MEKLLQKDTFFFFFRQDKKHLAKYSLTTITGTVNFMFKDNSSFCPNQLDTEFFENSLLAYYSDMDVLHFTEKKTFKFPTCPESVSSSYQLYSFTFQKSARMHHKIVMRQRCCHRSKISCNLANHNQEIIFLKMLGAIYY